MSKISKLVIGFLLIFSCSANADPRLVRADVCYVPTVAEALVQKQGPSSDFPNLSIFQEQSGKARGVYDQDSGIVCGSFNKGVFTGYWAETKSNQKCPTKKFGTYYWGRVRVVSQVGSTVIRTIDWDYCNTALIKLSRGSLKAEPLPAGVGIIPPIKNKWIEKMTAQEKQAAYAADCSCDTIDLGRVTYIPEDGSSSSKQVVYDLFNGPRTAPIEIPVLQKGDWSDSDMACFAFTFPKAMSYMSKGNQSHFCNVVVSVNSPHTFLGGGNGVTNTVKLYNAGGMGGGSIFGIKGPDARYAVYNLVCVINPILSEVVGPSGAKGYVEWSVRRSNVVKGGFKQEKCAKKEFVMK